MVTDIKAQGVRAAALAATCVLAALLAGCAASPTPVQSATAQTAQAAQVQTAEVSPSGEVSMPTITVSATSEVKVVPDRARINVSVTTQASTAQETQSSNASLSDAVVAAIQGLGVAEESIQTTSTYLSPRYDYSSSQWSGSEALIVGYDMTTRFSIGDLEIDKVGQVLQAAIDAGANGTDGIEYYSSTYDEAYRDALGKAVEDARVKAEALAGAAGVNLGAIRSIVEGYQNTAVRYDNMAYAEAAMGSADSLKIMPGQVDVVAQATVTYDVG